MQVNPAHRVLPLLLLLALVFQLVVLPAARSDPTAWSDSTACPDPASGSDPAAEGAETDPSTSSSPTDIESQIRGQDRQVFLELVKLAEFNVRFQQSVNHYASWRKLAYPLGQEAGYACFLAFSISDISQRSRGYNSPGKISPTSTKRALSTATVAALLGAGSSMIELGASGVDAVKAKKAGFSPHESVSFVQSTVKRVDEMLARRHELMEGSDLQGTRRELLELKEELLRYERDRLVFEFKRWSIHSRGYAWYKNAFNIINATVNMGRFSAVQLGFKSFTQPKCTGAVGPILLTSASLAALGPAASSGVGKCMQWYQKRSLAKTLSVSPFLSDQQAKQKFERLAALLGSDSTNKEHQQLAQDLIRLREEKLGLDTLIFHEEKNIERTRKVAGQQVITAPMISSLGASSAILGTIGYHAYRQQPLISNRLSFSGDAIVLPAELIALIATPRAALKTYSYERDLRKKGEHPDQLFSKRLKDLKLLEEFVSSRH